MVSIDCRSGARRRVMRWFRTFVRRVRALSTPTLLSRQKSTPSQKPSTTPSRSSGHRSALELGKKTTYALKQWPIRINFDTIPYGMGFCKVQKRSFWGSEGVFLWSWPCLLQLYGPTQGHHTLCGHIGIWPYLTLPLHAKWSHCWIRLYCRCISCVASQVWARHEGPRDIPSDTVKNNLRKTWPLML